MTTAPEKPQATIHATLLSLDDHGVLLQGPSGAGKSDLALRLIGLGHTPHLLSAAPRLVADDRVALTVRNGALWGEGPAPLKGLLEVRNIGILPVPYQEEVEIKAIVELESTSPLPRMIAPPPSQKEINGVSLPLVKLNPFEHSAPQKLILALRWVLQENREY